jgi:hypothetical protein
MSQQDRWLGSSLNQFVINIDDPFSFGTGIGEDLDSVSFSILV